MTRLLYLIIDGLPTFRPDVAVLWEKYLPREGCSADIITLREREVANDKSLWTTGEAFTIQRHPNALVNGVIDFTHDLWRLCRMRASNYDAIQVRDKFFAAALALFFARVRGLPFFYWMSFPYGPSLLALQKTAAVRRNPVRSAYLWWRGRVGDLLLRRLVLPNADHIFAQSDRMVEEIVGKGIDRAKVTPVPMCIDPDRFPDILPLTSLPSAPPGARIIGYLGECSKARRMDFLIEAVAHARKTQPEIFLLLVGDAIQQHEQIWLRETVERFGLKDCCHITGWVSSEVATTAIAAAEICLALMAPDPILDSTSPTKLVEYLAMGRPVVANHHPDQTAVIQESGAGVLAAFEIAAYGSQIASLLNRVDEHRSMSIRGRAWVIRERSYPKMATLLAKRYHDILAVFNTVSTQ